METNNPDWTSLPMPILADIANKLPSGSDVSHFKTVCKAFHSSLNPPLNPLEIPNPPIPDVNHLGHLELIESIFYSIRPLRHRTIEEDDSPMFIVKLQEARRGRMIVKQPFTRLRFRNLLNLLPRSINTTDYEVKKVMTAYDLKCVDAVTSKEDENIFEGFSKVVVSSTCLDDGDQEFSIMAIQSAGRLRFWRSGAKGWINMEMGTGGPGTAYEDVIFHNQKFYALEMSSAVQVIDPVSLHSSIAAAPLPNLIPLTFKYLVNWVNDLFLVVKIHFEENYTVEVFDSYPVRMEVYKLDIENHVWVQVNRLNDRVFFLGEDVSFSLSSLEFPELGSNCIYFNDNVFAATSDFYIPGWYPGIYDLERNGGAPFTAFHPNSRVFWPPPRWLRQNPGAVLRRPAMPRRYFGPNNRRRLR